MKYTGFAGVYDHLMMDTPYDTWFTHFKEIVKRYDIKGKDVLELACGTGAMTSRLAKAGYKVLGTDLSQEMLECAQANAFKEHLKVRYILQDMTDLELFQKYDMIVSFCDGFNYLTEESEFIKALQGSYVYLNEGGYLIFDMSSYYKLSKVLGENVIAENTDDLAFIWENYFDETTDLLEFDLTIFQQDGKHYVKHEEVHTQRAYTIENIQSMMKQVGFECLEVLDTDTGLAVKETSERWLFVGRKNNE